MSAPDNKTDYLPAPPVTNTALPNTKNIFEVSSCNFYWGFILKKRPGS